MPFNLLVYNPSNYQRRGYVAVPLQEIRRKTGFSSGQFILRDKNDNVLHTQVDSVDPEDPSRDILVFSLAQPIQPGPSDYSSYSDSISISVEQNEATVQKQNQIELSFETIEGSDGITRGVKLRNSRLEVYFNLLPSVEEDNRKWYAGSATSVQLDQKEMLDPFKAEMDWMGHDPEKRCMQIDRITLHYAPWEMIHHQEVVLIDKPYKFIHGSYGSVRATFTIASIPFGYTYSDPVTQNKIYFECQLYRIISLYADADYLLEELFVKAKPVKAGKSVSKAVNFFFTACYFMSTYMGHNPHLYWFENVPDWLAFGSKSSKPFPGYGFSCDVHIGSVAHPPRDFPDMDNWEKALSWELEPCKLARCSHLFMRNQEGVLTSRAGHSWYELIYKPLVAKFEGE
jgi:hypothetical protein